MNFVTRKQMSRRTLLRGAGTVIALPLLDAMFPALSRAATPARRLSVVYVPNGIIMKDWTPAATGTGFEFTRILKPLEPFREDITIVSGLASKASLAVPGGGDHAKATGSFLSGVAPKRTVGADVHAGVTFDQIAVKNGGDGTGQMGCMSN